MNDLTVIGKAGNFKLCFRDTTLASHAGVVLLQDLVERLGLAELIETEIELKTRARGHTEAESLLALCWNLILGGDCLSDLEVLRGDPGTQALLGLEGVIAPRTAGDFLRRFGIGDIRDLQRLLRRAGERVRPLQRSDRCTIDLDASIYEQCSTRKEGSRRAYNGEIGYHPLLAFWAEEGELLMTHLLAGNRYASSKALWLLGEVLKVVPADNPLFLRADSAFYIWKLIEELERREITYAITADLTQHLKAQIEALPEKAWRRYRQEPRAEVAELFYAPHPHPVHRYVVKRAPRINKQGVAYFVYHAVITTDLRRTPKAVMEWALGRCQMENLIKEHKTDFGLEKMPTQKFMANWAWLLIGQLAYNLVAWFKRLCLPAHYHTSTIKTLRHHLFNLAGKIVESSRQFFLVISDRYFYQDVWAFALKQLAKLQT